MKYHTRQEHDKLESLIVKRLEELAARQPDKVWAACYYPNTIPSYMFPNVIEALRGATDYASSDRRLVRVWKALLHHERDDNWDVFLVQESVFPHSTDDEPRFRYRLLLVFQHDKKKPWLWTWHDIAWPTPDRYMCVLAAINQSERQYEQASDAKVKKQLERVLASFDRMSSADGSGEE